MPNEIVELRYRRQSIIHQFNCQLKLRILQSRENHNLNTCWSIHTFIHAYPLSLPTSSPCPTSLPALAQLLPVTSLLHMAISIAPQLDAFCVRFSPSLLSTHKHATYHRFKNLTMARVVFLLRCLDTKIRPCRKTHLARYVHDCFHVLIYTLQSDLCKSAVKSDSHEDSGILIWHKAAGRFIFQWGSAGTLDPSWGPKPMAKRPPRVNLQVTSHP